MNIVYRVILLTAFFTLSVQITNAASNIKKNSNYTEDQDNRSILQIINDSKNITTTSREWEDFDTKHKRSFGTGLGLEISFGSSDMNMLLEGYQIVDMDIQYRGRGKTLFKKCNITSIFLNSSIYKCKYINDNFLFEYMLNGGMGVIRAKEKTLESSLINIVLRVGPSITCYYKRFGVGLGAHIGVSLSRTIPGKLFNNMFILASPMGLQCGIGSDYLVRIQKDPQSQLPTNPSFYNSLYCHATYKKGCYVFRISISSISQKYNISKEGNTTKIMLGQEGSLLKDENNDLCYLLANGVQIKVPYQEDIRALKGNMIYAPRELNSPKRAIIYGFEFRIEY